MKRIKVLLLLLPVLLFVALWIANDYKRSTPAYILAQYPKSSAFSNIVNSHLTEAQDGNIGRLFYSTWFPGGRPNVAMQCIVSNGGQMLTYRSTSYATQASHISQLEPSQLSLLRTALKDLPPSAEKPTLENLLIVSFQNGATWTTRVYDRSKLPEKVLKVYETIGASNIAGASVETAK